MPFVIPDKSVLIVEEGVIGIAAADPGSTETVSLQIVDPDTGFGFAIAVVEIGTNSSGAGRGRFALRRGFPVKPGALLCINGLPGEAGALVYGYLTKDR